MSRVLRNQRGVWILLLLVLPLTTVCGTGGAPNASEARPTSSSSAAGIDGNFSVAAARAFTKYGIYWAGEAVEGYSLSAVDRAAYTFDGRDTDIATFSYGRCDASEGTCFRPIQIQSSTYCLRPMEQTAREARTGPIFAYRGATAEWVSQSLVLHFRDSTVNISASVSDGYEALALRVADQLFAINAAARQSGLSEPGGDLGPIAAKCTQQ